MKKTFFMAVIFGVMLTTVLLTGCCEHETAIDPVIEATCIETGLSEGSHCNLCGEILVAQEIIPANGHNEEAIPAQEATCVDSGLTEGTACSVCKDILVAQETIPANGHTEEVISAKDATCTEDGLTEGTACTVCGEILVAQETIPANGHTEKVTKKGKAATCTESGLTDAKECSVCGVVLAEQKDIAPLGHTTSIGTCTRCKVVLGIWDLYYYVDEFNMPTNQAYVYNEDLIIGTFSNSATTDSALKVMILVDKENVNIFLYEYGKYQVKNNSSYSDDWYDVTIRMANGSKVEYDACIYGGFDRLQFQTKDYSSVVNALKSGEKIAIYIVNQKYPTTNYLFQVETSNFKDVFQSMK